MNFTNWRDYQNEVAAFFRRQGCEAEVEKKVRGIRSKHEIDVYVTFLRSGIRCTWIVECKLWKTRVPKEKVMALKAIVEDLGADRGIIISEKGFQSGAQDAVRDSNLTLVTSLVEFEQTTKTRTIEKQLYCVNESDSVPLYEYPDNSKPQAILRYRNLLITANWGTGTISLINPKKRTVIRTIDLDNYEHKTLTTGKKEIRQYPPGSMTIADGRLYVGQVFSEFLLVIDIETLSIIKRINLPGGGEGELTASPDEKYIYFASNRVNQFYQIDSATFEHETINYPSGGRGCISISVHPSGNHLYIGIQRGGTLNGKSYSGGNCFLAIYDLQNRAYLKNIYLAEVHEGHSDDASPACIEVDSYSDRIFVGMFQSLRGICVIDVNLYEIVTDIRFHKNKHNKHFEWVDPLSVKVFKGYLICLNRNNRELVVLDKLTFQTLKSFYVGEASNGPRDIEIFDEEVFITYPEKNGLVILSID